MQVKIEVLEKALLVASEYRVVLDEQRHITQVRTAIFTLTVNEHYLSGAKDFIMEKGACYPGMTCRQNIR